MGIKISRLEKIPNAGDFRDFSLGIFGFPEFFDKAQNKKSRSRNPGSRFGIPKKSHPDLENKEKFENLASFELFRCSRTFFFEN